jgi:DNA-binding CsgD family transcriptional regulator
MAAGERYLDPSLGAKLVIPEAGRLTEPLSAREYDVMRLLALGYRNQEIGKMLFNSVRTVDSHRGAHHAQARSRIPSGARALRACERADRRQLSETRRPTPFPHRVRAASDGTGGVVAG